MKLLKIKMNTGQNKNLLQEITDKSMDHMMAGIEQIMGHHGDFYLMVILIEGHSGAHDWTIGKANNIWSTNQELIVNYNEKYFKKWFLSEQSNSRLTKLFEKIALTWDMLYNGKIFAPPPSLTPSYSSATFCSPTNQNWPLQGRREYPMGRRKYKLLPVCYIAQDA